MLLMFAEARGIQPSSVLSNDFYLFKYLYPDSFNFFLDQNRKNYKRKSKETKTREETHAGTQ